MSSPSTPNLERPPIQKSSWFDRFFRDSEGNIVIIQIPNLPVLVGLTATLLQFFLPPSHLQTALGLIAFGTLFTWAWQEIFTGVNYFRRSLGLISLVGLMVLALSLSRG